MDASILFKLAGLGLITSMINTLLKKSDKDEIATLVTLSALVLGLLTVLDDRRPIRQYPLGFPTVLICKSFKSSALDCWVSSSPAYSKRTSPNLPCSYYWQAV